MNLPVNIISSVLLAAFILSFVYTIYSSSQLYRLRKKFYELLNESLENDHPNIQMGQGLSQHDIISNAQDYTTFLKLLSNYTRQWNPLFFLSGPYYGKTFSYAQISGKPGLYSILFFHMKKIAIGNLSIKIFSDNSLVVGGKSMQLESSDFNENFKNSFYNQPGALEFATPSVMQTMLELKEQFHDVNIEYFVNSDSDDATLAVFVKGYIFPFPDYDATQIDIYWENFETFAGKAAKLTQ